jgi:hypothetical protein
LKYPCNERPDSREEERRSSQGLIWNNFQDTLTEKSEE